MGIFSRSSISRKSKDGMKIIATAFFGVTFGFLIGISFPSLSITKVSLPTNFLPSNDLSYIEEKGSKIATPESHKAWSSSKGNDSSSSTPIDKSKIWVPSNPRGAEMLPPGMVAAESDFYLRRLWGLPHEDLKSEPRYLATFTVGINQKANIDACVKKFSENFTIVLFHYDGRVTEWDEFEWSKTAIHISVRKQTKWYQTLFILYGRK